MILAREILAGHDVSGGGLITTLCEMAFGGELGIAIEVPGSKNDALRFLFSEKPGVVLQVRASRVASVLAEFAQLGTKATIIAAVGGNEISLSADSLKFSESVKNLREVWFKPSYLLDSKQTRPKHAKARFENLGKFPLQYKFPEKFTGRAADYGVDLKRIEPTGIKAAIIREKGTNGDREMAFSLFAAGFDVKDVTMSDLISGRETLKDLRCIVFPGGFSNSDVLGAGRGWAGVFRYNEKAYRSVMEFFERPDTLALGVCNGCQLMASLDLLCADKPEKIEMRQNESGKFESTFVNVDVQKTNSIFLRDLIGARLGIWIAHGEGRFRLPGKEKDYDIALKFSASDYPACPNGADFAAAAVSSSDGRHLMIMPHLERSVFPWQWPHYPYSERASHEVSPWIMAFRSAFLWAKG